MDGHLNACHGGLHCGMVGGVACSEVVVGMLVVGELVIDELLGELGARVFCHGKLRCWRVSGVDSHGLLVVMGN